MEAANDNLQDAVSGFDEWETLHAAAQRVVEACARERTASHQVGAAGGNAARENKASAHPSCPERIGRLDARMR